MLHPLVKSCLFKLYCLSLYGCSLWNLSCHSLCSIELSLNNILRCIWDLSRNCHTGILHLTTLLPSIFNVVQSRSSTLFSRALSSPYVGKTIFCNSSVLAFTQMLCLVINLQSLSSPTWHASVLKLSVIFVFMETHQRSMT